LFLLEDPSHFPEQPPGHKWPSKVPPPGAPVDRLRGKKVKTIIAGGKDLGFDPARRPNQNGMEMRRMFFQRSRNGQRRHQVSSGTAAGDKNSLGSGAAGQRGIT
jgi:hypothetical protein